MNRVAVRELVAGLGVILSLLFVAVQIRANTDAVRGGNLARVVAHEVMGKSLANQLRPPT